MGSRAPTRLAKTSAGHSKGAPRRRILLAEDDREMRVLIASALCRDGYEVVEVNDGAELLTQMAEAYLSPEVGQFDLVITDHRMPRVAGLDVLRGLRLSHDTPPVILITAFGGREMRTTAKSLGAVAVFDKPFQMEDLRTAVQFVFSPAFQRIQRRSGGIND